MMCLLLRGILGSLGVIFYLSPASAVVFTDVTLQAGINHFQTTDALLAGLQTDGFLTGGAAAGDFDRDGLVDLVFTRLNDVDILYHNLGNGTFEPRTAIAGFNVPTLTNGVVSGDVDNDGDLDLYMTGNGATRNYLYLNDGTGFFGDAGTSTPAALANSIVRLGQGASFGDYDKDGYLDLATADWGNLTSKSQSRLLRNLGVSQPGEFEDVTVQAGIDQYRAGGTLRFSPRFVDLDRDGLMDLTFAADFGTSQLFWNNGDGTFTDGTIPAGVGTDRNGMGTTFGDYDLDGDLDWFITNITEPPGVVTPFGGWNRLYRNEGNRTFTDVTQAAGVRDSRWAWGTSFFDYDNDGDLDLIATNGYNGQGWVDDQTFLWRNDNGIYTNVSTDLGIVDTKQGRGLIQLDFDLDGDLDLVIVNNKDQPVLYRNDGGNENHYLRIDTEGTVSNRDGIGAWITVVPDLNFPDQRMVWEIDGGSSFLSQNERTAHFGLGALRDSIDLITIEWPSGILQCLVGVGADQTIHIVEQAAGDPADFDHDQDVDSDDLALWQAVLGLYPAADADADGDTDGIDFLAWQRGFGVRTAVTSVEIPEPGCRWLVSIASLVSCGVASRLNFTRRR